jgi:Mn-containing catalase
MEATRAAFYRVCDILQLSGDREDPPTEIVVAKLVEFAKAGERESLGKPRFSIGRIAPTAGLVDQFFNDSTGEGEHGEIDTRGPWNEGGDWVFVQAPALQEMTDRSDGTIQSQSSDIAASDTMQELLVDQLRDLLHAEKQLLKALPKMVESARFAQLKNLFELHLEETEHQVQRLEECFKELDVAARAKPCKGMMGIIEEGEEVMQEAKKTDDAAADLSLIAAAQRVEHYEASGYGSARNLARQLRTPVIVQLLSASLAEEENADQLLNQLAQTLMSAAKMPAAVE